MGQRTWIKIYCQNWLNGSTKTDSMELKGAWITLLTLTGNCTFGAEFELKLSDSVGYPDVSIAELMGVDVRKWRKYKAEFVQQDRITVGTKNIIKINNWRKYQSEYLRQKSYRINCNPKLQPKVTRKKEKENKKKEIYKEKRKYLDFVFLLSEEYQELLAKYGNTTTQAYIEKLNAYIGSKGKRYKSHYHTILSWLHKDNITGKKWNEM